MDRRWTLAAVAAALAIATTAFLVQSGTFFRGSDWDGLTRFHDGPSWNPVDGSLSLASGAVFGLVAPLAEWTFWPYRLVGVAAFAVALVAVFWLSSRVAGPMIGLLSLFLLGTFSQAAPLLTQPFLMRFPLTIALIAALALAVDSRAGGADVRSRGARRAVDLSDAAVTVLFAAALATSVAGFAAIPIVVIALGTSRAPWPRWLTHLTPFGVWLAWFAWRGTLETEVWSWTSRGQYFASLFGRAFQHLACNSATLGTVAAGATAAVLWSDPGRRSGLAWRPLRWLAAAGVFGVVTTYTNGSVWVRPLGGHPPDAHSWVVAVFLVLSVVESVRDRHHSISSNWRQAGAGIAIAVVTLSSITLHHAMASGRAESSGLNLPVDTLAAIESGPPLVDDTWIVSMDFVDTPARGYQGVAAHLGSPLDALGVEHNDSPEALRTRDEILVAGLGITARPGDCQWTSPPENLIETANAGRIIVASLDPNSATDVFITRLSSPSDAGRPLAVVAAGETAVIDVPDPGDGEKWTVWTEGFGVVGTCQA